MTTIEIRTSERRSLKRCQQKWYWSFMEGLTPIRDSNPLWFGSAVHEALAEWYQLGTKRGTHPSETFSKYLEGNRSIIVPNGYEDEEKEYVDARELGISMLNNYVRTFGTDPDWDVIATEQPFRIVIKHPDGFNIRYVGTWDGVYRDRTTGLIWLMEHKTAASLNPTHLPIDDQAGSYWAVASQILIKCGVLKKGEEIAGIMYNFLRKQKWDARPQNEQGLRTNKPQKKHYIEAIMNYVGEDAPADEMADWEKDLPKMSLPELEEQAQTFDLTVLGEVSSTQPAAYFERIPVYRTRAERTRMIQRIKDEATYIHAYRTGVPGYPITKNPTWNCSWDCEFFRLCQLNESGDEYEEEFKASQFKVRNPYEAHHDTKSADG